MASAWETFVSQVKDLGAAGVDAYNTYTDAELNSALADKANTPPPASTTPKWLLPVGIGAAALVLLLILLSAFKPGK